MVLKRLFTLLFATVLVLLLTFTCNRTSIVSYSPNLEAYSVKHSAFIGDGVFYTSPWYSDGIVLTSEDAAEIWELLKNASMDNSGKVIAGDAQFLFEESDKIHRRTATQILMNRSIDMPDDFVLGEFSEDLDSLCMLSKPSTADAYLAFRYHRYKQLVAGEAGVLIRRAGHCQLEKTQRLYDRFARLRTEK